MTPGERSDLSERSRLPGSAILASRNECGSCQPAFRDLVQSALLTGCRYSELTALVVADFNSDAGIVAVRTSKSGEPRHVVLTDEGQKFFTSMTVGRNPDAPIFTAEDGDVWGNSHQLRRMRVACARAHIKPAVSFHVLRHTRLHARHEGRSDGSYCSATRPR
jgi:integrase